MVFDETINKKGEWHDPNAICPECGAHIYVDTLSKASICSDCGNPIITKEAVKLFTQDQRKNASEQIKTSSRNTVSGLLKQIKDERPEDIREAAKESGRKAIGSVANLVRKIEDNPEDLRHMAKQSSEKVFGSVKGFIGGAVEQVKTEKKSFATQTSVAEEYKITRAEEANLQAFDNTLKEEILKEPRECGEQEKILKEQGEREKEKKSGKNNFKGDEGNYEKQVEIVTGQEKQSMLDEKTQLDPPKQKKSTKSKKTKKKSFPLSLVAVILVVVFSITALIVVLVEKNDGRIKIPASASELVAMDYEEAKSVLEEAGFTSISLEPDYDVVFGWFNSVGDVESVSVDGVTSFSSGTKYEAEAPIIIKYHASVSNNPSIEHEIASEEKEPEYKETEKDFSHIPVPEYAKRAAVVAWENAIASDVWLDDGSDYDPSKFHSYADMSGTLSDYFIFVKEWGDWKTIDENVSHVDGIRLEYHDGYNIIRDYYLSMDVTFDFPTNSYQISNLRHTLDAENEKFGPFNTNGSCYLVPYDLVEEDRDEEAVDAADKTDEITDVQALTAFRKMGEQLFPYGFKVHNISSLSETYQYADGSWDIKRKVTIKNEYGAKLDALVSAYINNITKKVENFQIEEYL